MTLSIAGADFSSLSLYHMEQDQAGQSKTRTFHNFPFTTEFHFQESATMKQVDLVQCTYLHHHICTAFTYNSFMLFLKTKTDDSTLVTLERIWYIASSSFSPSTYNNNNKWEYVKYVILRCLAVVQFLL